MSYPYGQQNQGYPGQQPGYAPAQPQFQQPGYPAQQGYQPPPQPQPAYGQPHPQQQFAAPPPGPRATLDDFMEQPAAAEGKSLAFDTPGTRYVCTVARNVTSADLDRQTDPVTGAVQKYPDGRDKLVLKVPVLIQPTAVYTDGFAVLYVNATLRNEMHRAMAAVGMEPGAPNAGDVIDITFTHAQQGGRPGMSPRKVKKIVYAPGNGEPPRAPMQPSVGAPVETPYGPAQFTGAQWGGQPFQPAPTTQVQQPPQTSAPAYDQVQQAYQQATGQQMAPPPQQPGPYQPQQGQFHSPGGASPAAQAVPQPGLYGQPQAEWNAYAPPTGAPGAPPQQTAQAMPGASPSSAPPPDWPADVPFRPGLTVEQARMAAAHNIPGPAQQQ